MNMTKFNRKKYKRFSFKRIYKSFNYAFCGIKSAFITESSMIVHLFGAIFVLLCGFYFNISIIEWLFLILCIGLIFITELINTSIEYTVDLISDKYSSLAKGAKDSASASVLFSAILSSIIGLIIFVPKILELF
ncbi:MAG: diacylglycerol kinase [Bacilli bacterium]